MELEVFSSLLRESILFFMDTIRRERLTYIGKTTFRRQGRLFGIREADRFSHLYLIGRTGTGKSTLLGIMALQDLAAGQGLALLDPHGDLVEELLGRISPDRRSDVLYLNAPDASATWTYNPLGGVSPERRALAVAGLVEVFRRLWHEDWGPRLEHLMRNVLLTLLELPEASLGDIPPLLADKDFRSRALRHVENAEVRSFWTTEYARYSPAFRAVVNAPLQNKVGAFLSDPILKRILTGRRSSFNLRRTMDEGKVLLVNLSKGRMGEGPASLLGSLLVSSLSLAGLSRTELPEVDRRPFLVYLDEFQTFGTLSLATMLSELRKYKVGMVLAHQYVGQLDHELRDAVLGNVGTLIAFRVGAQDAPLIARELAPKFEPEDLISLPNYHIYLRLLINGEPSRPFSAETLGW